MQDLVAGCRIFAGLDPLNVIIKEIKEACKGKKSVPHKNNWSLFSKGKQTIASLANELQAAMAYGFVSGMSYSSIAEAGRSLAAACKATTPLDLLEQGTPYRSILELHQCMTLEGKPSHTFLT